MRNINRLTESGFFPQCDSFYREQYLHRAGESSAKALSCFKVVQRVHKPPVLSLLDDFVLKEALLSSARGLGQFWS